MLETPKMRIHYIQRHLHGVEAEFVSGSDLQHPEMNERILMAGKTDVTDLPCLPGVHHGFDRPAGCKDSVRVFQSDDLMQLHQINSIRLQPLQGFINLPRGRRLGAAVALGHEKDFLAVAVTQSLPHANFAGPAIVIPAVSNEGDPLVNGPRDNVYARPSAGRAEVLAVLEVELAVENVKKLETG